MGTRAIEVARFGGPEVLALSSIPEPVAGPGQAVISVAAADVQRLPADHEPDQADDPNAGAQGPACPSTAGSA